MNESFRLSIKSSGTVNGRIREKSEHRREYYRRARGNKRTVSDVRGLERIVSIIPIKRAKSRRNRSSGTRDMTATSPPLMGRQVGKPVGMHREKGNITVSILVSTRCYCINTSNWEMAEG